MVLVRRGRVEDSDQLGRVHVAAWRAAYRGCMPDDYLDGLRAEDRSELWRHQLTELSTASAATADTVWVAERKERVVGFAAVGNCPDEAGVGELYALNVDPRHWATGVGRTLLTRAEHQLAEAGCSEAVLWVLPGNGRARRFYAQAGWWPDRGERTAEVLGVTVAELRYRHQLTRPASLPQT